MKKVIFLDRDGTINIDKSYLYRIEEFEYIEGAVEGMRRLNELGYILIVVTNQSGIARGYYSEKEFIELNNWMINDLKGRGVTISETFYCPHLQEGNVKNYNIACNCRKPKTGLFWEAIKKYDVDLEHSYVVGDKMRDLQICYESNIKGILLNEDKRESILNFKVVKNLFEAAEYIIGRDNNGECY